MNIGSHFPRKLLAMLLVIPFGPLLADETTAASRPPDYVFILLIGLMAVIIIMTIVAFNYLQRKLLDKCKDMECLREYFGLPFGVPVGTVRSVITFIIIALGLMFFSVKVFYGDLISIPETLSNIIMAVIAFYFGTRSGARSPEMKKEKIPSPPPQQKQQVRQLLAKTRKVIEQVDEAKKVLPDEQEKSIDSILGTARKYLEEAERAEEQGDYSVAKTIADLVEDLLKRQNGVKDLLQNAVGTLGTIIGANPATALVGGVLRIGSTMAGDAYDKWRRRVLEQPIQVSDVNPNILDADTAQSVFMSIDLFKRSFRDELLSNKPEDKQKLLTILKELALGDSPDELYEKYKAQLQATPEEFAASLQRLREMLVDVDLSRALGTVDFGELNNYQNFENYVALIQDDKEGSQVMNQLMTLVDRIREKQIDVTRFLDYLREIAGQKD